MWRKLLLLALSIGCTKPDARLEYGARRWCRRLSLRAGPAFNAGMRDACESRPGLRSTDPGVAVLVGENKRVTNGVGRIEIHVAQSGAACVEITYPWS